jgi:hypothetical protein
MPEVDGVLKGDSVVVGSSSVLTRNSSSAVFISSIKSCFMESFFAIIYDIVVFNSPTISLSNGFTPVYVTPING